MGERPEEAAVVVVSLSGMSSETCGKSILIAKLVSIRLIG
jgi:hypothetical protein